ncbi:putative BolA protein [Helianthus anomalus]
MSFSSSFRLFFPKFPNSLPLFKTLTLSPFPLSSINLQIIKPITIQSIPTRSFPINSTSQSSSNPNNNTLQPIEELPQKLQEIINLFRSVQDPRAKYEQLLFYGKNLKPLETQFKTDENKVKGCVSQVWLRAYFDSDNKNVIFEADSDSVLTKGLAALLVQGLSGHTVQEILRVSPDFIVLLGLQQSLTPSRNNGFLNMLKLMQKKAFTLFVEAEKGVESGNEINKPVEKPESGSNFENPIENSESNNDDDDDVDVGVLGSRGQRILEILKRELAPVELEVKDVSYQHAGHAGVRGSNNVETHFELKVVSKEFEGKSMVKRHRLVYSLLEDELENGLHALSIDAKTPTEIGH